MTATTAGGHSWRLRFSLRELLIVMLLVAVAIWITSWRVWDFDERLILSSWFVAVCVAIARGRSKKRRGIGLAAFAGGCVPGFAYVTYLAWVYLKLLPDERPNAYWTSNLLATVVTGMLTGTVTAWAFTPPALEDDPPHFRADRLLRRRVVFVGSVIVGVLLIGGWTAYRRSQKWDVRSIELLSNTDLVISHDGRRVAGYRNPLRVTKSDPAVLESVALTSKPLSRTHLTFDRTIESIALSPDGEQIAVALFKDDQPQLIRFDSATGQPLPPIKVEIAARVTEIEPAVAFAPNGRQIMLRTIVLDESLRTRIRTWNLTDQTLAGRQDYQDASFMYRAGNEIRLLRLSDGLQGVQIGVIDPKTGHEAWSIGPFHKFYPQVFSSDGNWLGINTTLIDLRTGKEKELPAVIHAFTPDCRHVIGVEEAQDADFEYSFWTDSSTRALPLLRHLWFQGIHSRIVVLNTESGARVRASQWTNGTVLQQIQVSGDASIAVVSGWFGNVHVWTIPSVADR